MRAQGNPTRREAISLAAGAGALAFLPHGVWALSDSEARRLVDTVIAKINAVIASGKSESAMIAEFERIFRAYADTSYIAAYAMGVDGRRASAAQKKAFSNAFISYLSRKYGKRFREFIGARLEIQTVRPIKNYVEVSTMAFLRGQAPFDVTFHVSDRTGKGLFFNLYIEGVNMLLTERAEVGAMLDKRRGDIDAMIADIRRAG